MHACDAALDASTFTFTFTIIAGLGMTGVNVALA